MFKIKNDNNEVLLEGEDYTELVQKMFLMIEYGNVKERLSIFDENRKITLISLSKKLNINLIPLINNKKIEYLKNNFSKDTLFSIIKDDGTVVDEFYNLVITKIFSLPRSSDIYKKIGISYMEYFRYKQ